MVRKNFGYLICTAAVILIGSMLIWACAEAAEEAKKAVTLCLTVMIPSLYAFTVISKLLISSNVYRLIAKPFSLFSRYVLRIPPEHFTVFIISQLAGYPIGAALINQMCVEGKIKKENAQQLLVFCIAPGPAYISAVAASAAPEYPGISGRIFAAVAGANLLALLLTSPFRKIPLKSTEKISLSFTNETFTFAVKSAAESMTMICSMIIFTASLMGILRKAGVLRLMSSLLSSVFCIDIIQGYPIIRSFFEISNLTALIGNALLVIPIAAALLSFGGICVHFQIISVCGSFSFVKALILRIPISLMAFVISKLIMPKMFLGYVVSVNAPSTEITIGNNQPILSIFLLIMTILIISQKTIVKSKKM